MTVYARSDISAVSVSGAHGGCGKTHSRPAPGGNPAPLWALDCPPCEDHLRSDPHWSATVSEVPETYDEKLTREDFQKRGVFDRDAVMAMAMAKIAGVDLPETLRRPLTGLAPHIPGGVTCPEGHPNRAGAKFCSECGAGIPAEAATVTVTCANGHENPGSPKFCGECGTPVNAEALALPPASPPKPAADLGAMSDSQLRALARELGLSAAGKKADVLARLKAVL